VVKGWSETEVARHALAVLPVRSGPGLEPLSVTPAVVARYADNRKWLAQQRIRLSSPSWLLRLVKQEVSRRANAEDGCTGPFWERRFTSVALLDASATLACMVYVDLNPLRAGLVKAPETSLFTSIRHRAARVRAGTRSDPSSVDSELGAQLVAMPQCAPPHERTGAQERWTISEGDYLDIVDETARCLTTIRIAGQRQLGLPVVSLLGVSRLRSWAGGSDARKTYHQPAGRALYADTSVRSFANSVC
jgi:hypothetical protein